MAELDTLELVISANANEATQALDKLSSRLESVSDLLGSIANGSMQGFSNNVNELVSAIRSLSSADTKGIKRLSNLPTLIDNLGNSLNTIEATNLTNIGYGLESFADAMNAFKGIRTDTFERVATGLNEITKVSGDYANVATYIGELGNSLAMFSTVSSSVTDASVALKNLTHVLRIFGKDGVKEASANIPGFTENVRLLVEGLSKIEPVGEDVQKTLQAVADVLRETRVASKTVKATSNNIEKASKSMGKGLINISYAMGKFYASFGYVRKWAKDIWSVVESSMNYVETYNYFNVITGKIESEFGNAGLESAEAFTDNYRDEMAKLVRKMTGYSLGLNGELVNTGKIGLGADANQLLNFQARISSITNSVGLLGEQSEITTKALSMLSNDLASLTNQDVDVVMDNLTSGLVGMAKTMYKYGIDITSANLEQIAMNEGIEKSVSEMTQAEKMQLRLIAILKQSKASWGDMAETVGSVANQYRIFQQQTNNLGRTLGSVFLPIIQRVLPYINGVVVALNNLMTAIGTATWGETWLKDLNDGIGSGYVDTGLDDLADDADNATDSIEKLKTSVRGFDELNIVNTGNSSNTDDINRTIDLTETLSRYMKDYESVWETAISNMNNKAEILAETITKKLNLKDLGESLGGFNASLKELVDTVSPITDAFGGSIISFLTELTSTSFTTLSGIVDIVTELFDIAPNTALEATGLALGKVVGSLVTLAGINKAIDIVKALQGFFATKIATSDVTFGKLEAVLLIMAGLQGIREMGTEFNLNALIGGVDLSELEKISQALANYKSIEEGITALGENSRLLDLFNAWSELNSNLENLTDNEKGLLKTYADQIKTAFPEATKYINEQGEAYKGAYAELKKLVELEDLRIKRDAAEGVKKNLYTEQIELGFTLKDSEGEIEKLYQNALNRFGKAFVGDDAEGFARLIKYYYENPLDNLEKIFIGGGSNRNMLEDVIKNYGEVFSNYIDALDRYNSMNEKLNAINDIIAEIDESIEDISKSELTVNVEPALKQLDRVQKKVEQLYLDNLPLDFSEKAIEEIEKAMKAETVKGYGIVNQTIKPDTSIKTSSVKAELSKAQVGYDVWKNPSKMSDYMVESIAQGVSDAIQKKTQEMELNVKLTLDPLSKNFFTAMQQEATLYTNRTGNAPFAN